MLQFNDSGLLVPNTNIQASINDLELEFVTKIPSEKRKDLFASYLNYSKNLKAICGNEVLLQWIDGSFVTKVQNPGDIDLVSFINFDILEKYQKELASFKYPNSLIEFNVDAYIVAVYPNSHPNYHLYCFDQKYWMSYFDKTRRNNRGNRNAKGFLEIKF